MLTESIIFFVVIALAILCIGMAFRRSSKYRSAWQKEKENFQVMLRSIGDGVIVTDTDGNVTMLNTKAEMLTGWKKEEAESKPFTTVFNISHEDETKTVENPIEKVLDTGKEFWLSEHAVLHSKDGISRNVADSASPIHNDKGELQGVVMVFRDVTEQRAASEKIRHLSVYDALTGLYNRGYFEHEIAHLENSESVPIAIIMGDVNGLKLTNDVFGHQKGDDLLVEMAHILKKCASEQDIVARWGGDEFVVCMPSADEKDAEALCARIQRAAKEAKVKKPDGEMAASISLGWHVKQSTDKTLREVFFEAENMMYHNKLLESQTVHNEIMSFVQDKLYHMQFGMQERLESIRAFCWEVGRRCRSMTPALRELEKVAKFHNVGIIAIDEQILNKTEPLTEFEWEQIQRHPEIGYRIALSTPEFASIADYILAHHERWDGTGYPRGIKGKDIPLFARIVAVAEAYDAMIHGRLGREPMPHKQAVEELKKGAGTQFDPYIVDLMTQTLEMADKMLSSAPHLKGTKTHRDMIEYIRELTDGKSATAHQRIEKKETYCVQLAHRYHFPQEEVYRMQKFCRLHDIGMIAVESNILLKPEPLTDEERAKIHRHPQIGYDVALISSEMAHCADSILAHHEHWDGGGYPNGQKGKEIPLPARIVAVVEAYDVMTHERPYGKALTKQDAITELKNNAGTQFDPQVVELFVGMLEGEAAK